MWQLRGVQWKILGGLSYHLLHVSGLENTTGSVHYMELTTSLSSVFKWLWSFFIFSKQWMPGDGVNFAFIFFILICPVGIFNHWTLSMYWMVYLRKLISCLFWQTPEQCDKKQKMRKEGLRIVNGELVMKTCMQRPWMMLVRLEINCNKYPMCDVLWSDLKRTPDVVVQTLSTRCHYSQFD